MTSYEIGWGYGVPKPPNGHFWKLREASIGGRHKLILMKRGRFLSRKVKSKRLDRLYGEDMIESIAFAAREIIERRRYE